jgi:hypothetical protein
MNIAKLLGRPTQSQNFGLSVCVRLFVSTRLPNRISNLLFLVFFTSENMAFKAVCYASVVNVKGRLKSGKYACRADVKASC